MKKIDIPLLVEVAGVVLAAAGIAMFSVPVALIAVGVFLVWATEKVN